MRILTRYILREVVSHALIGAAVFTFVLFTRDLGRILELVVRNSAPLPSIAEVFFFTVPVALTYTIPMGVLVGILIGLSRLAADSEITAMRASGLGVWTFLRVISIFVVVAWLLALGNSVYLAPRSLAALGQLQDNLKSSRLRSNSSPACFTRGSRKLSCTCRTSKPCPAARLEGRVPANLTDPSAPRISLAREGCSFSQGPDTLDLHLTDGSTHKATPRIRTSTRSPPSRPLTFPSRSPRHKTVRNTNPHRSVKSNTPDLLRGHGPPTRSPAAGT